MLRQPRIILGLFIVSSMFFAYGLRLSEDGEKPFGPFAVSAVLLAIALWIARAYWMALRVARELSKRRAVRRD